jgi:hypothetical protein
MTGACRAGRIAEPTDAVNEYYAQLELTKAEGNYVISATLERQVT